MKSKKFILLGLLVIALVFGLAGCAETCAESIAGVGACKVSWTNGSRDSGSMLCANKKCNVNKNWNKSGTSSSCNC